MRAKPIDDTRTETIQGEIRAVIEVGSTIHTDEHCGYFGLGRDYIHQTINHKTGEYVRDDVTTNGIENV